MQPVSGACVMGLKQPVGTVGGADCKKIHVSR